MSGLSEQQLAEIRARLYQVRALSAADVDITALLAEVARLNAPLPGEEAIREQVRRVLAAADNYPYEELEPHDYQEQATVTVDMIRPLVAELGSTRARIAELEAERDAVRGEVADAVMCTDDECLNRHHLPKIAGLLGGVGLVDAPEAGGSRG